MFLSQVSLVDFYAHLLPAAQAVGYRLVLTALVREADAPRFYEDVARYWSSLHDATGPDILFVFAGADAGRELDTKGIRVRGEGWGYETPHVAFHGRHDNAQEMLWSEPVDGWPAMAKKPPAELVRGMPVLGEDDEVATNHTLEIGTLRRFLGLAEADLPCLCLSALSPVSQEWLQPITVPLAAMGDTTTYMFVKALAEALAESFSKIDAVEGAISSIAAPVTTLSLEGDQTLSVDDPSDELAAQRDMERDAWDHLRASIDAFLRRWQERGIPSWHYFIAYSSPDHHIAERVHSELSAHGTTFLDSRCVRPGDRWTERIRQAQSDSRATVLLLTKNTPSSWFTESEYLFAIDLMRSGDHVLIPVLYGADAAVPYGLQQVQAAKVADWNDLSKLPSLVSHVVESASEPE